MLYSLSLSLSLWERVGVRAVKMAFFVLLRGRASTQDAAKPAML